MKQTPDPSALETQLTFDASGHFLNQRQVFSPSDAWVAFDGRNEDSKIGENGVIGLLNLASGEQRIVYQLPNQTVYGPGAGAVSFHPVKDEVIFIRGLLDADSLKPYHLTRRTGIGLELGDLEHPRVIPRDARDSSAPYTAGALRGGTHAYGYNGDGNWISFTYNDAVLEREAISNAEVKDLRTIGVMIADRRVEVEASDLGASEFSGSHFSVLVASVVPFPKPGTDQINKAYEECWIGENGYLNTDGQRVCRALAFLGDLLDENGRIITEVFIADLPDNVSDLTGSAGLEGSQTDFPTVPEAVHQRRLTHTSTRKYPGIQGPRQWIRTSPDGERIYLYAKSDEGLVQIYYVSPNEGELVQVTDNAFSPDTMFSVSPDGDWIAYGFENQIYLTHSSRGSTFSYPKPGSESSDLSNINWSHAGDRIVYNRKVSGPQGAFYQIFQLFPFKN